MNQLATQTKIRTIRDLFERAKPQIALAVPKHLSPERIMRVAMTAIQRTPKLLECDPQSLLASLMQCAQLGLEPDGILGHAYLVPFKNNKRGGILEAQFMVGYKGLISLARRSGEVQSINAQVVYSNDEFDYSYGLDEKLYHRPTRGEKGRPIAAYCVARFKDGGHAFEVMSYEDVEGIRKRSRAAEEGPWVTDWPEMARKTVVRKLAKYLPLSIEFQKAAALDEYAAAGLSTLESADLPELVTTATASNGKGHDEPFNDTVDPEQVQKFSNHEVIKSLNRGMVDKYLAEVATGNKTTPESVMVFALKDMVAFQKAFAKWVAKLPVPGTANGKKGPSPLKAINQNKEENEAAPGEGSPMNPVDTLSDFICLADEDMDHALTEKLTKNGYKKSFIKQPINEFSREEKVSLWNMIDKLAQSKNGSDGD